MASSNTLAKYRTKRDFSKTSEPKGIAAKKKGHSYLIQKHEASHLHYDFRLELDGVLKSWAVPKGPALDPQVKRLAMEVEDHPVAYGSFEGTIPEGEYGGGTVMLWDRGTWEPVGDAAEGLKKGKLTFQLHGERLKGEWTLVRFNAHEKKKNHWFLIKHRDEEVVEGDKGGFVEGNVTSIVTGRSMDEIAKAKDKVWGSKNASAKVKVPAKRKPAAKRKKQKALPAFIEPQLATLSTTMPKGNNWRHEIKFDGYRMLAFIENGKTTFKSRNNKDWTTAFKPLADLLADLPGNAVIDGEVVAMDKNGRSDFNDLKNALSEGKSASLQYYAFDMLIDNGEDLRKLPLAERKAHLQAVLTKLPAKARKHVFYSEDFADEDGKFLQGVCNLHLEGVISKRADAPYVSGRGTSWLKTKCIKREEMVIGGYTLPSNGSKGIGALLLGYYDEGELTYAGRVGTGWNGDLSLKLRSMLDKLVTEKSEFISMTPLGRRGAKWVKPKLVCQIEFTEWTPDGHMRHPSFEGLREDKAAQDVHRDFAITPPLAEKKAAKEVKQAKKTVAGKGKVDVGGIGISHPERVIYTEDGITKQQLADYYLKIAGHIMPYIKERPLSMLRCPEGTKEACFYQRHIGLGSSPHLHEIDIPVKGKKQTYMMIKDEKGLISLIQWGVIELHAWQCTSKHLDKPDRLIFDLDPAPDVKWPRMIEAALEIQSRMKEFSLTSFLKTTGGKGLHVVIPLTPTFGWGSLKAFARAIAESMVHDSPDRYISKMSKAERKGLIFVDYLRNDITSTAVAPFSARAREHATVSTPLAWSELSKINPSDFTIETVPTRLAKQKNDPWAGFLTLKQKLSAAHLKALGITPD